MFGEGISRFGELVDLAAEHDIVRKSGAWFSYGEQRIGQGRENAKSFMKENADIADEVERKVRETLGLVKPSKSDTDEETEEDEE